MYQNIEKCRLCKKCNLQTSIYSAMNYSINVLYFNSSSKTR